MTFVHLFAELNFPVELSARRFSHRTSNKRGVRWNAGEGKGGSLSTQRPKEIIVRFSIALLADSLLLTGHTRNRG